jgi:3beta-hydroxy-delta5-steroid dehydrogenase/steroid delta-isomerase
MIRQFLDTLSAGQFKALIGSGKSKVDNTHIENLTDAQLLSAAALRAHPEVAGGQAYFITDDETMNCLEWFRPLVEALGHPYPRLRLPGGMMRQVGWLLEVSHYFGAPEPTMTRRGIRNVTESASFSIEKARRDLTYTPRYNRANGIPPLVPIAQRYIAARR